MHRGYLYRPFWGSYLIPIILIILIGIAVYMLLSNMKKDTKVEKSEERQETSSALEILNERYAKGEIDEAEYQRIKKNLTKY